MTNGDKTIFSLGFLTKGFILVLAWIWLSGLVFWSQQIQIIFILVAGIWLLRG